MADDLRQAYRTIMDDHFPDRMEISFVSGAQRSTLVYEKVVWVIAVWQASGQDQPDRCRQCAQYSALHDGSPGGRDHQAQ